MLYENLLDEEDEPLYLGLPDLENHESQVQFNWNSNSMVTQGGFQKAVLSLIREKFRTIYYDLFRVGNTRNYE